MHPEPPTASLLVLTRVSVYQPSLFVLALQPAVSLPLNAAPPEATFGSLFLAPSVYVVPLVQPPYESVPATLAAF